MQTFNEIYMALVVHEIHWVKIISVSASYLAVLIQYLFCKNDHCITRYCNRVRGIEKKAEHVKIRRSSIVNHNTVFLFDHVLVSLVYIQFFQQYRYQCKIPHIGRNNQDKFSLHRNYLMIKQMYWWVISVFVTVAFRIIWFKGFSSRSSIFRMLLMSSTPDILSNLG